MAQLGVRATGDEGTRAAAGLAPRGAGESQTNLFFLQREPLLWIRSAEDYSAISGES